jgi:hypothetical protein
LKNQKKKLQNRFVYDGFEVLVMVTVVFWDVTLDIFLEYEVEVKFERPHVAVASPGRQRYSFSVMNLINPLKRKEP